VNFIFLLSKEVELSNSKVGPLLTRLLDAFWGAPKHDNNTEKWRLVHSLFLRPLERRSEGVHKVPPLPKPRARIQEQIVFWTNKPLIQYT
jgi:hypothetical protein